MVAELKTIVRAYDAELIKITASGLIYLLSNKSREQLQRDEKLALSYRNEPGDRRVWEDLHGSLQTVLNPLHSDNVISFTHGLYVTLQQVFNGTMTGINLPQGVTEEQKTEAFRSWIYQVANDLVGMSLGKCSQTSSGGSDDVEEEEDED